MKLYDWDFAPNCRRVRMYMYEKGIELPKKDVITPEIKLNDGYADYYPHYMVPMLELDDGTQIGEALSIWIYLEEKYPTPPLMGVHPVEKAMISAWERRAYDEGIVGHAEIFRNSHPNFVDRGLPGHRLKIEQIPALIERGKHRVTHYYEKLEKQLATNNFVVGDRFSVADINAVIVVDFGLALEMPVPDIYPNIQSYYDRLKDRPSVKRSMTKHMPDGTPIPQAA